MKRGILKRSQISIFIIIAVIIVAIIVLFLLLRGSSAPERIMSPEIQPIHDYFETCIKDTAQRAIYSIGWSGGYFHYNENSTENGIAYYYMNGKNTMPKIDVVQDELSSYMNKLSEYCAEDLNQFSEFVIKTSQTSTKTTIENNKVVFEVIYPLTITKEKSNYFIKNFNVDIDTRLGEMYEFSKNITEQQINDKGKVCISCINQQANERNFYVELNDYDNETTIFTIVDKKYKIMDDDFRFNFANKYKV